MNKKYIIIILSTLAVLLLLFIIDAKFGIMTKENGANPLATNGTTPQDFRKAETVVVETYTGILPSEKCGDLSTTVILKKEGIVSIVQEQGKCSKEYKNSITNGTYTNSEKDLILTIENKKYTFSFKENVLSLEEIASFYKKDGKKVYSLEKTRVVNYATKNNESLIQVEYAAFGKSKVAKIALSNSSKIVLRSESADGLYSNIVYKWTDNDTEATLSTATTSAAYYKE